VHLMMAEGSVSPDVEQQASLGLSVNFSGQE
jgi:hypothetical protein